MLANFTHEGRYWVSNVDMRQRPKHGECAPGYETCNMPEGVFINDRPLVPVLTKEAVDVGRFYIDFRSGEIYLADDPNQGEVEIAAAVFAVFQQRE